MGRPALGVAAARRPARRPLMTAVLTLRWRSLPGNRGPRPSPRWGSPLRPPARGHGDAHRHSLHLGLRRWPHSFPLLDFDRYATGAAYQFANPLAIEFGFWGFWVWGLYFLSAAYFCLFEPRLKLFEHPWVKTLHNGIILGTCAFTAYLFLLGSGLSPEPQPAPTLALVAVVVPWPWPRASAFRSSAGLAWAPP